MLREANLRRLDMGFGKIGKDRVSLPGGIATHVGNGNSPFG
jgi:hypothetical protein